MCLEHLARRRQMARGEATDICALFEVAWEEPELHPESAARWVYDSVGVLRKTGVGEVLERVEHGYRLSPSREVTREA